MVMDMSDLSNRFDVKRAGCKIRLSHLASVAVGSMCVLGMGEATAASWQFTPTISISETYTDNVLLSPVGQEQSDWVTDISIGAGLTATGARARLGVQYTPSLYTYAGLNETDLRHNLSSSTQLEVVEDHLFISGNVSVSETFSSSLDGISVSERNFSEDRRRVGSYSVVPRWVHSFGSWASASLQYSYQYSDIGSTANLGAQPVSNAANTSASLNIASGQNFGRLGWGVNLTRRRESRSDTTADDVNNDQANFNARYNLSHVFALTGSLGLQDYGFTSNTQDLSGVTWNAGVSITPSRRTNLNVSYGRQTNNNSLTVSGSYQVTARTSLSGTYNETYQTSQGLLAADAENLGNSLFDTGPQPIFGFGLFGQNAQNIPQFDLGNGVFLQKKYNLSFRHQFRRTSVGASAYLEDRIQQGLSVDKSKGLRGNISRDFGRYMSANLSGNYARREGTTGRNDDTYTGSVRLDRRLAGSASLFLSYDYTKRTSSDVTAEIEENAITLGLSTSF